MSELTEELFGAPMYENEDEMPTDAAETPIDSYTYHEPEHGNYWIPVGTIVILCLLIVGLAVLFFFELF